MVPTFKNLDTYFDLGQFVKNVINKFQFLCVHKFMENNYLVTINWERTLSFLNQRYDTKTFKDLHRIFIQPTKIQSFLLVYGKTFP